MLYSGLVGDGRAGLSQRDIEPRVLLYLGTLHHGHTLVTDNSINTLTQHTEQPTELVGSTKIPSRGFPNTSPEK